MSFYEYINVTQICFIQLIKMITFRISCFLFFSVRLKLTELWPCKVTLFTTPVLTIKARKSRESDTGVVSAPLGQFQKYRKEKTRKIDNLLPLKVV